MKFVSAFILIGALFAGIYLVRNNQLLQKGATAVETSSSILPNKVNVDLKKNFSVHVWLNTGKSTDKLQGAEFRVYYDGSKLTYVSVEPQSGFTLVNEAATVNQIEANGNRYLDIKLVNMSDEPGGAVDVAKLNFTGKNSGIVNMTVKQGKLMISGQTTTWNVATNNASKINIGPVGPTPTPPDLCTAWKSINVNGCSEEEWSTNPKGADCKVSSRNVQLNLNAIAKTMSFANTTTNISCPSLDDSAYSGSRDYAATTNWTLPATTGERRVCVKLTKGNGSSDKCGALIKIVEPGAVTPTPVMPISPTVTLAPGSTTPTNLTATCSNDGTKVTLSWDAVPTALGYGVLVDDPTNDTSSCENGWLCSNTADRWTTDISTLSYTTDAVPDKTLYWSLYPQNGNGFISHSEVLSFKCIGSLTATPTAEPSSPVASPTTVDATGMLMFKTTFAGVLANAECANNWKAQVTVLWDNAQTKTFDNVLLTSTGNTEGLMEFAGQVPIAEVGSKNNLAVFIKGPRHLQTKYGVDGQSDYYSQVGGEINWADDKIFDFTKYANLDGDVTGPNGVQDGKVDGLDFAYIKSEVAKRTAGDDLAADLNGNCQLESQDLSLLMTAMSDKMGQLY